MGLSPEEKQLSQPKNFSEEIISRKVRKAVFKTLRTSRTLREVLTDAPYNFFTFFASPLEREVADKVDAVADGNASVCSSPAGFNVAVFHANPPQFCDVALDIGKQAVVERSY